jgi:hypothetical protein
MTNSQIISYLEDIVAPTQTLNLTWWQTRIRDLAEKLKEEQMSANTKHSEGRDMTKISGELLPCPFCGGSAEISGASIECVNSDCWGPAIHHFAHAEDSIEAWNTRTSPPPSGEAGEMTDEMVERAVDAWMGSNGRDVHAIMRHALEAALPTIKEPTDE